MTDSGCMRATQEARAQIAEGTRAAANTGTAGEKMERFLSARRFGTFFITINILFAVVVAEIGFWMHSTIVDLVRPEASPGYAMVADARIRLRVPMPIGHPIGQSRGARIAVPAGTELPVAPVEDSEPAPVGPVAQWLALTVTIMTFFVVFLLWLYFNRVFIYNRESWFGEAAAYLLCFTCLAAVSVFSTVLNWKSLFGCTSGLAGMLWLNNGAAVRALLQRGGQQNPLLPLIGGFRLRSKIYTAISLILLTVSTLCPRSFVLADPSGRVDYMTTRYISLAVCVALTLGLTWAIGRYHIPQMEKLENDMLTYAARNPAELVIGRQTEPVVDAEQSLLQAAPGVRGKDS